MTIRGIWAALPPDEKMLTVLALFAVMTVAMPKAWRFMVALFRPHAPLPPNSNLPFP